jgi:hypothetical protein
VRFRQSSPHTKQLGQLFAERNPLSAPVRSEKPLEIGGSRRSSASLEHALLGSRQ